MIRQLCPNCTKMVELPDDSAGSEAPCPNCHEMMQVPDAEPSTPEPIAEEKESGTYGMSPEPTPKPERPTPPPGFIPPKERNTSPTGNAHSAPMGYTRDYGIELAPRILGWVPVACITIVFFLTFAAWVGSYPGGVRVYSQSAWDALFGSIEVNSLPKSLVEDETEINDAVGTDWLMLPYLLLLLVTLIFLWADRFLPEPEKQRVPTRLSWVPMIWPWRLPLLCGFLFLLWLMLFIQAWNGFGLEDAIAEKVALNHDDEPRDKVAERLEYDVRTGKEYAQAGLIHTFAYEVVMTCHVVALLSMLLFWWVERRGRKPLPQLRVYW